MLEVGNDYSVVALIKQLIESPFTFHLTGSHFFGTAHDDSDVDFFVELPNGCELNKQTDLTTFLEQTLHMHNTGGGSYSDTDNLVVAVYTTVVIYPPVHVQIVLDAEVKALAQNMMKNLGIAPTLPSQWTKAYEYARKLLGQT